MASREQQRRLLKAKIAVALRDELGRVPTREEIKRVFLLTRVMYKPGCTAKVCVEREP